MCGSPGLPREPEPVPDRLARILFIGPHDANSMVRKLVMRSRQLEFRHVTGDAPATGRGARFRTRFAAPVAGLALCVIFGWIGTHFMVRIMASETADARVVSVIALTARQSVWLKADIADVQRALQRDFFPGSVTLSAEIGNPLGGQGG